MAKDPAMLWYWADWHSGTVTFSRFMKGCYMDVLHAQFNSGHLSLEEIKTVLGSDFGQAWPALQKKFTVDPTGKYFNERLEEEKIKRANYTASRRSNLKNSHMDNHMESHMDNHMENVNGNRNTIGSKSKKGVDDFETFGQKSKVFVTVKAVYAGQKPKRIYDLTKYFESSEQLTGLMEAGWIDFEGFMRANPSAVFDDDNHLYNAFRKFNLFKKSAANGSVMTFEELQ